MEAVGFSEDEISSIKTEVDHYVAVKDEVAIGAGENIDMKQYEAGMRQLLDTYIHAKPAEPVADLEKPLVQVIVERGADAIDSLPAGVKSSTAATTETIINNVRKTIVDEHAMNPRYYNHMSELLDALIEKRRQDALDYKEYLDRLLDLATQVGKKESETVYPDWAENGAQRALVDFDFEVPNLAVKVDTTITKHKEHGWVGNRMKERALQRELHRVLPEDFDRFDELFELVKARDEYR
jgi:type I restriction enzyme R subunit